MQEATERDPWFPTNIPRPIRRKVLKEFIKQHYKKVYLPQCQRIEQSRLRWLEDERKRRSLEMARMFIHSDSNDWVNEFGDDKLMLLCPFVRGPFMVHSLPEDQVDRLIKRGIDLTIQEYRLEKQQYIREEGQRLKAQKDAAATALKEAS